MNNQVFITYIIFTLHTVAFFIQLMDLPFIAKRQGTSDATFGIVQTLFGTLQILGGPIFGILINKFGMKLSLHICNLMTIVMSMTLITFNSTFGLFLSRIPGFLMQGMQAHKSLLAELTEPGAERTNAFGKIGLCFGLSFVFAPLINRFASIYSDTAPLYISMILSAMAVWITQFLILEKNLKTDQAKKDDDYKDESFTWNAIVKLSQKENVLSLFLQKNISILSAFVGFMVLQLYLIEQFDVTQKENSIIQMMMGICLMFVSALGLPMLRKNFTEPQLIILGIFAFIIASLQFCYFAHFYQLAIILPAFSFGMGVINPVCESLLSSAVEPQEQALMLGLSTSSFTFMQAIAPGIGGLILQNYGFHLCGIFGVLGSTTALVIGYLFPIVDKNFKAKMS